MSIESKSNECIKFDGQILKKIKSKKSTFKGNDKKFELIPFND